MGDRRRSTSARTTPTVRLEVLDECGIDAQIIFPNTIGLGGQDLGTASRTRRSAASCVEIYNDAHGRDPGRVGQPAPADAAHAGVGRRRLRRARPSGSPRSGARGVNMTSDPQDLGAPDLANRAWDPFWEACAELQLPVHFHIGASVTAMDFYGKYPWASHPTNTQARDRRHAAVHRQRARRRSTLILSGHVRPPPRPEDGVGRERRRLDPVHPRGARLRDVGERARRARAS